MAQLLSHTLQQRITFLQSFRAFRAKHATRDLDMPLRWYHRHACLADATRDMPFDRQYLFHTAWAARILADLRPTLHHDFSSLHLFAATVSAFIPVRYHEFRPAQMRLRGLTTHEADLLQLPYADASIESASCLHVIEHLGLGRYGDPIDAHADRAAATELARVVRPGGSLLIATPVGQPRVEFNAHRVYSHRQVLELFPTLRLERSALIPDNARDGDVIEDAEEGFIDEQTYACGCYYFRKAA